MPFKLFAKIYNKIYLSIYRARMGNFLGWGGPLSQDWHNFTIALQHSILTRMRELGIIPVLPAFAGHVPRNLIRVFPTANFTKVGPWMNFEDKYCW